MLPEAAQGALALQVRAGEEELVAHADHAETRRRVEAERACAAAVGAGCLAPVAAHHDGERLHALIAAEDGSWLEHAQRRRSGRARRRADRRGSAQRKCAREGDRHPPARPGAAARASGSRRAATTSSSAR